MKLSNRQQAVDTREKLAAHYEEACQREMDTKELQQLTPYIPLGDPSINSKKN